ncbi:tubulin-tyrsoine ligase-like protein [Leptomonas pyrrhocoris]|uniref:Tubulin-tyrsoine ligase-like protein n=1 Tax=Leptomonas pyrrhocoris TaxID=157538 RepID=A0A0M9FVI7_LEPPY|nr:tubulin-tyrsoine ligase-like protein [Leptomonas pyrrhocoris]KPA76950.1 tubulin-tyrsoine ligase-like protein [Leptomonas pyrrhocoris]|eukprot:XP_015655389.1 tubulin-tyrsoine ligase-like protein [Leptomonas pyrrhocoris]
MTSAAERVPEAAAEHTGQEDVPVGNPADAELPAVSETPEETPEAVSAEAPPTKPLPLATATAAAAAAIQVYEPYQVDLISPRHAHPVHQTPHLNGGGTHEAVRESKASTRSGSSAMTPAPKLKGRPSQAPLHTARVARTREAAPRSRSQGQPRRSNRRPPLAAAPSNGAPASTVLPTSTRRVPARGEASKTAAAAAAATTTTARTSTNGSSRVLLRRPRFVDPLATTAPTTTTTSAEPAQRTKPARPADATALPVAAALANHAPRFISSIPYRHPTHTPQRAPAPPDNSAADTHHRRRLLNDLHAAGGAHRNGGGGGSENGEASAAAATSLESTKMSNGTAAAAVVAPLDSSRPSSPVAEAETDETTDSEAAVEGHEKDEDRAAEPTQTSEEKTTLEKTDAATATTTSDAAKLAPHYTHPTRESQMRVIAGTVTSHPSKRVILSRPTTNPSSLRMSELTRPSEAYKVSLNSSHQGSSLARRSRQPRTVLNVFLTKYPVIRRLADELGWVMETTEEELNDYKFNLCWSDTVLSLMRLVRLSNWQRTNHFPSMYLLCRKGHLGTTLGRLRHKLPLHFAFYPRTWSMRSERLQFTQYMAAVRQRRLLKYFIMKPNSGCQGRGIVVARDPLTALEEHTLDNYIVQEYVHRPLLLEGKKFDLRVYVLLTSIRHPSIFLFNDGLVRICTEQYETPTEENVKNACKHLTNYAVNKKSTDYVFNTDVEHMDVGNKRNFAFLNRWLEESGHSADEVWHQVSMTIVKTILAAQPSIARVYDSCFPTGYNDGYCCFEVLGFDILIDHKMKPWLMEVNHTPSFATETPLDMDIKSKLLTEVWSIIDCKATDYEKDRQREREEFTKRNMPPWASNHPLYGSQLNPAGVRHGAADDVESPVTVNSSVSGTHNNPAEIPPYVYTRRQHEDSKLRQFKRIYPSEIEEVQLMYDTIQNLALAESANNRLYYNSTVTAPMPAASSTSAVSTGPYGMRGANTLPLRTRPPSLGPVLTSSRVYNGVTSPSTTAPQRSLTSPVMTPPPAVLAPPNGAPLTIPVNSVPSLTIIRDSHQSSPVTTTTATATATGGVSTTSPHAFSSVASRGEPSAAKSRVQAVGLPSNMSTSRNSMTPSEHAHNHNNSTTPTTTTSEPSLAPPLSLASLAAAEADAMRHDGGRVSNGTTPKASTTTAAAAAAGEQTSVPAVRVFTPRISSPVVNSRTTTAASTPAAAAATSKKSTNNESSPTPTPAAAKSPAESAAVKPRVAEVYRRPSTRPSNASLSTLTLHELVPEEHVSQTAAPADPATTASTPASVTLPSQKGLPLKVDKPESTPAANSLPNTYHQNGSVVTPPAGDEAQKNHANGSMIRLTRTSVGRQKSPSLDPSLIHPNNGNSNGDQQPLSSSVIAKRRSRSTSSSGRGAGNGATTSAAPPRSRQKSTDREGRNMSTHPEPTEEELARLVELQAQLDYESAADPQPDDEDEDYNLTE